MTFQPSLPLSGYAGWRYLDRTLDDQLARLDANPVDARDIAYFREAIPGVTSASDLVADYRLLRVALTAFGLQDDLPNRAFVERVLSDGVDGSDALANRLADKRYREMSAAFGFGSDLPPQTQGFGFADRILNQFTRQSFETAVGATDPDLRLALYADRTLPELATRDLTEATAWLTVMGDPPLRQVFETAFGLPASTGTLDLDQQIRNFQEGAERVFGDGGVAQFSNEATREALIRQFTLQSEIAAGPSPFTPGMSALVLLQSANGF